MPDDREPSTARDAVAHNDQELMALLDADSEDRLAWVLFAEIDGGVHLLDGEGVQLFMGEATDVLTYPIRIAELQEIARRMEASEDARLTAEFDATHERAEPGDLLLWVGDDGEPRVQNVPPPLSD